MDRYHKEGKGNVRLWGIVISVFYAAVVMGLLLPGWGTLSEDSAEFLALYPEIIAGIFELYTDPELEMIWLTHVWPLMLIGGQVLLLFLSVDTSWQRRKPRSHIALSITVTAMLVALLSFSAIWSLTVGFLGGEGLEYLLVVSGAINIELNNWNPDWNPTTGLVTWWVGLWIIWAIAFYAYNKARSFHIEKGVSWLLKGSILELLIAVSAHVAVLQLGKTYIPMVTAFSLVTGIAILLICFTPRLLSLFKRRIEPHRKSDSEQSPTKDILKE